MTDPSPIAGPSPIVRKWYPPTNDYAFKCVFGNPQHLEVTAGFIKDFFNIEVAPKDLQILNNTSIDQAKFEHLSADGQRKFFETLRDVTIEIQPAKITIEMQVNNQRNFLKRSYFYSSRLYIENYAIDDLIKDNYETLKPVWSMNILAHTRFEQDNEPYRIFALRDEQTAAPITEWQPVRLGYFEIPKQLRFAGAEPDAASKRRTAWAQFLKTGIAPDDAPEYIKTGAGIIYRVNTDPKEAKMIDAFEKATADQNAREYWARIDGKEEGIAEGIARMAENLLRNGYPVAEVAAGAGLSVAELEELLQRQPVGT